MSPILSFKRDAGGYNTFALPYTPITADIILTANVETVVAVPSINPYWIVYFSFSPGSSVWVFLNSTAVLPTTTLRLNSGGQQNPGVRSFQGGDMLHFITRDSGDEVGVVMYVDPYRGGGGI